MAKDIKIIPSVNRIEFTGSDANTTSSIEMDNLGRLKISSSQVIFGDGNTNDIYIGDGSGSSYIVFDQNGGIKGEAGQNVRVTLGSPDTRVELTGSEISIKSGDITIDGPETLNLPPITSSFAQIHSGSFTGSISVEDINLTTITSSDSLILVINASDEVITNINSTSITSSGIQLNTGSAIQFTSSDATKGGSIELDNLGNLVLDSVSGSVYLSKDNGDIFIGDGTSSANIVFDFDGAIKGEDGQSINLTLGSPDTILYITGSRIEMGAITSSNALIQGGIITASAASIGDVEIENDSININSITSSYVSSSVSVVSDQGTFNYISSSFQVSSSIFSVPTTGRILFTGSDDSIGGEIKLDAVGNLTFSTLSGSVFLGDESNVFYVGDGTSSASMIFDAGGIIKSDDSTSLTLGSPGSNVFITASNLTLQQNGGDINLDGNTIATGSFTGSFTGDGSGLTNVPISSSITTGSFTGSFDGDGSLLTDVSASYINVTESIRAGQAGDSSANTPALLVNSAGTETTQAAIAIQQQYTEGDTIIFADYGSAVQWNFYHENTSNTFRIHGGSTTNNYLTSSVTFYDPSGNSRTGYVKHIFDQNDGTLSIAGNLNVGSTGSGAKLDVSGSARIYPTSSGVPGYTGTDGEFVFGTDGGNHYIYTWMAGAWRSSSLA